MNLRQPFDVVETGQRFCSYFLLYNGASNERWYIQIGLQCRVVVNPCPVPYRVNLPVPSARAHVTEAGHDDTVYIIIPDLTNILHPKYRVTDEQDTLVDQRSYAGNRRIRCIDDAGFDY